MPFLCHLQNLHFGRNAFRKGDADAKAFRFIPLYQPFFACNRKGIGNANLCGRASFASEGRFCGGRDLPFSQSKGRRISFATAKALVTQTFAAERVLRAKAAVAAAETCPLTQGEGRRNSPATAQANFTHGRHARAAADYIIKVM